MGRPSSSVFVDGVLHKKCPCCGVSKPHSQYNSVKSRAHGISAYCKVCSSQKALKRHSENPEKHRSMTAKWRARNPDRVKATSDAWHAANREYKLQTATDWHFANRDRANDARARRRLENIEVEREKIREYCRDNPHVYNAKTSRRRTMRVAVTRPYDPEFYGLVEIEAYHLARLRTTLTGIPWRVDHVIPITPPKCQSLGSIVLRKKLCGPVFPTFSTIHNEFNFAVITDAENGRKSNRMWPGKP